MPTQPQTAPAQQPEDVELFLGKLLQKLSVDVADDAKTTDLLSAAFPAPPAAGAQPAPQTPVEARRAYAIKLLGVLFCNLDYAKRVENSEATEPEYRFDAQTFADMLSRINDVLGKQLNEVFHRPEFREIEGTWQSIAQLVDKTDFASNIGITLLDASKEEIYEDLSVNVADVAASEIYKKAYVAEFDQLGGEPYGAAIGLYEFEDSYKDRVWLRTMASVCKHSHMPFIASASPKLFELDSMRQLMDVREPADKLSDAWRDLRDLEDFAYIGLTLPRYVVRRPYRSGDSAGGAVRFEEQPVSAEQEEQRYVWGSSAMVFARNLVRSFQNAGWCQYLRGVKGGGHVSGLAKIEIDGPLGKELLPPVEVVIPDYAELALANAGFIPLVYKKGSTEAVFFSCPSIKTWHDGADPHIAENAQLTTNLAYTFSISRIAHYLKKMMRDNVGSNADANYTKLQIDTWLSRYVTTIVNPDDLTLRYYPFKAYALDVQPIDGRAGWYTASVAIQPHIQFEGMDVTLRVDARLAKA